MKVFLVFLHNGRHKALHKAVKAMESKVDIQHNRHIHLGDSMVMYGIYNVEILENLINTVHQMHNTTTPNEKLFAGQLSTTFTWYANKNGVHHYTINSPLYLRTLREKFVKNVQRIHTTVMHVC